MFFRALQKRSRPPADRTRRRLSLEFLEDRTLLTYFTVSAVADVSASGDATANLAYPSDETPDVQVTLTLQAFPDGEGMRMGSFRAGIDSRFLRIDSAPAPGQKMGDPIVVRFDIGYLARLRTFLGWPPVEESYLNFVGTIDGGNVSDSLFSGSFSTNYSPGDETEEVKSFLINMNVGDSILASMFIDGQAHSVANHYRDWVDFSANIEVADADTNAPARVRNIPSGLVNLFVQEGQTRKTPQATLQGIAPNSRCSDNHVREVDVAARPMRSAPDRGAPMFHRAGEVTPPPDSFDWARVGAL